MHTKPPLLIRLITHNIRFAADPPSKGEEKWEVRQPLLHSHFVYHTAHIPTSILCLQEVLHGQLRDILSSLNGNGPPANESQSNLTSEWEYIGVGRDDGKQAGEYAPIIYRPRTWRLLDWKTYWLSESGKVGRKGWDAASIRICTVGAFQHRESGKRVIILNTHLDDQGELARVGGARIVRSQADKWSSFYAASARDRVGVVVAGDLNSEPDGEAYKILNNYYGNGITSDVRSSAILAYGNEMTFTGFDDKKEEKQHLDFIFVGPSSTTESYWKVKQYGVLPNRFDDGAATAYHSDHRAVVADMELMHDS